MPTNTMTETRPNLLVVDDLTANIDILTEDLSKSYSVRIATSGANALDSVKKYPPDLILLDVMMPGLDGFEVCRRLKADPTTRNIPVIFLTALNEDADEARGLALGAVDYITKPFNQAIVKARIRNHLELKKHRDRAEKALQSSEERYRIEALNLKKHIELSQLREAELYKTLAEKSFSGVFLIQDERFVYITKQAADYYGYDVESLIGTKPEKIVFPEDRVSIRLLAVDMLKGNRTTPYEYRVITKDNKVRWIMETISPINFDGRPAFMGNCIDITERRQREIQDLHSQKLEAVGQLAAGIAHEINTPIQFVGDNIHFMEGAFQDILSVISMLDLLKNIDSRDLPSVRGLIERISKKKEGIDFGYLSAEIPLAIRQSLDGLQRVTKILQAMREFSHPGGEEMSSMDINKAIESTITLSRNEWKYSADLTATLASDLPLVQGYPADFNQVILNLIVNAAQALQEKVEKGKAVKGRIEISTRQDGKDVEICIRDTGPGIPPEAQSRVFDPFFTTKEVGKGTGQGLAIAQNIIVHKHGGKIFFETKPGEGTAFYIRLPIETP